jgi:pyruvate kinase
MAASETLLVPSVSSVRQLAARLERVRRSLIELERSVDLTSFGAQSESARNLLHYLAFRQFDLRRDQDRLSQWGLSSLGRSEGHVLHSLDAVLGWLDRLLDRPPTTHPASAGPDPGEGRRILARNAQTLLGPVAAEGRVRIMVTMPAEAATDELLVPALMARGMDCARINCAHDGPTEWASIISHIHRAERILGRTCKIEMDLPGPKIRTGAIQPGPPVLKLRPTRDAFGRVTAAASVWLVPSGDSASAYADGARVSLPRDWLLRRRLREQVEFVDARGANRRLRLVQQAGARWRAETRKTAYIATGEVFIGTAEDGEEDSSPVEAVPPIAQRIRLAIGDRLVLTARPDPGDVARRDSRGRLTRPAHIPCTFPEALKHVRRGDRVWFDDGRIGSVARAANGERLIVEITHAPAGGTWLGADKGINLPDTELRLPPIPPEDLDTLRFIARNADLVGFSFVHSAGDLLQLRAELARMGRPKMGIILKIETRRAFEELPGILLAALRQPPMGVMIARGDLAVEVGFERLAEVQEEILWLCEAAGLPAIWATQVLEGLAKSGIPSRAEVTDAAMGERAECVMLNKGPYILEAVQALDSILRRMQSHQAKKTAKLRHLHIVERFLSRHRATHPAGANWAGDSLAKAEA